MKILMTGSEWFDSRPGGLNRYFQDLYVALQSRPEAEVAGYAFGEPVAGGSTWGPVGQSLPARLSAARKLPPLRGAVVDRHFALYGPTPWLDRRRAGAFVIHFQGPWYDESRVAGGRPMTVAAKRFAEFLQYRGADAAVVLCEEFKNIIVDRFRFPAERVRVLPPGVDLDRFQVLPVVQDAPPMVLCVRRLERRMGIDVLLDAWAAVAAEVPGAELVIVGDGTERDALREQASANNLPRVTFAGRVSDEDLAALYARARLTVAPTRALEGFGLIALESLASGRPVVVTDVGGLPDSVSGLDPSLIVPSEDPVALAERLITALDGAVPDSTQCREHAELFAWDRVAERHLGLYDELLA